MEEIYLDDYVRNAQGNFIATLSNGREISVNGKDIDKFVTKGKMKEIDAIEMWLADNGHLDSDEQNALDESAKKVKIQHNAQSEKKAKKSTKPRTVKVSDTKKALFGNIYENLSEIYGENARIEKENKLIIVQIDGKTFKIDLIEQRPKKN